VAAYHLPTFGALPSFLFFVKELFDTFLLDIFKVFDNAHPEKSLVAFIDMMESFAREIPAFKAELYLSIQK
jgi:hypothetical protein